MLNGHIIETEPQTVDLRVIKADANALRAHWPWLREKLLIIKRNNEYPEAKDRPHGKPKGELMVHGRCRWTPEQIRFEIMRGILNQNSIELFFFVGPDFEGRNDEIKGFAVTTCYLDPFLHIPADFVAWLGWSCSWRTSDEMCVRLEDLARERGCTGAEHCSSRMGWARRMAQYGYSLKYIVWRKELV